MMVINNLSLSFWGVMYKAKNMWGPKKGQTHGKQRQLVLIL